MRRGNKLFAICDAETAYAYRFLDYLSRRQNLMFELRAFTSTEMLLAYAAEHPIEILLIAERSMCDEVAALPVKKLIILSEGDVRPSCAPYLNVYKYQSADALVREIMDSYGNDETDAGERSRLARGIDVIGVYSPVPPPQKSLFSLALAFAYANEQRTLYLNLEIFPGIAEFAGISYERTLGDLLYWFRKESGSFAEKLGGVTHHFGQLDYIPPLRSPSDYLEISGEEWIRFFETIANDCNYELLVLDLGMAIPDILMLLAYCREIFVPTAGDGFSDARFAEFASLLGDTDNGVVRERMRRVCPPEIRTEENGQAVIEGLPYSALGRFASEECTAGGRAFR